MALILDDTITMDTEGDNTHLELPNQSIYIQRIDVYGGPADGDLCLLDHDGELREGPGRHNAHPDNQVDPRPILATGVAADSYTSIEIHGRRRGAFLSNIPTGGKIEIILGGERNA